MARRLYRSRTQKAVAGVCGGLGEYFNIDPALVRVGFVVLSFLNGLGIIGYVAMWLVFPWQVPQEEPAPEAVGAEASRAEPAGKEEEPLFKPRPQRAYFLGIILVALGLLWLYTSVNQTFFELFGLPIVRPTYIWERVYFAVWPVLIVAGGIIVLVMRVKEK